MDNEFSLETHGLCYLRFRKNCEIVATECSINFSDVIGYDGTYVYEIEVKRTFSDFKADFKKHRKHSYFSKNKGYVNYFYFLVDDSIKDKCLEYLKDYPKYGLLITSPNEKEYCMSVKKATKIHNIGPKEWVVRTIKLRMGSDLCNKYIKYDTLKKEIK